MEVRNIEYKGIGIRLVAQIVDGIIGLILFLIAGFIFTGSFTFQLMGAEAMGFGGVFGVLFFLYFFLMEGYKGQTVGKMVTGMKVVKDDGEPCDMQASFIRNILRIIDGIFVYLVGAIFIATSDKKQRLGDRIAGTVVVSA